MAFKHGKSTLVVFNAKDLSTYLNAADFTADADTGDTTTFQATWKTALMGQASAKAGFQGFYDPTVTELTSSIGVEFGSILTYAPAGAAAIGDRARLLSVATTSYGESSPVGGIVAVKWNVMASGPVGFGDILHLPSVVDSGTTTGATKDDTAATSTGWIAHLHVLAVSSGSWTVKLQDASASNFSDGADVAGASFTAATGATFQRLTGAATATLRRYVRYVATVVGGSTPTITFLLAYSRISTP